MIVEAIVFGPWKSSIQVGSRVGCFFSGHEWLADGNSNHANGWIQSVDASGRVNVVFDGQVVTVVNIDQRPLHCGNRCQVQVMEDELCAFWTSDEHGNASVLEAIYAKREGKRHRPGRVMLDKRLTLDDHFELEVGRLAKKGGGKSK